MVASGTHNNETNIRCRTTKHAVARKRSGKQQCVNRQVKLRLVEDAVVTLVRGKFERPDAIRSMQAGYSRRIKQEAEVLNRDRRVLERDRADINRRLDATMDAAMTSGLTTKAVSEQRQKLCVKLDEIDQKLASIPRVVLSKRFATFPADAASYLADLVPGRDYRHCTEHLATVVAMFRRLVGRVVVFCEPGDIVRVKLEGPIADVEGPASQDCVPATRKAGTVRHANVRARRGDFEIAEADWNKIRSELPCGPIWLESSDTPLDFKRVIEAVLFLKHTGVGYVNLPEDVWGPRDGIWAAARSLSYAGVLDLVEEQMKKAKFELVRGVRLSLEANRSKRTDPVQRYVDWNLRRRDRVQARLAKAASGRSAVS
jgi:hypothetical protein